MGSRVYMSLLLLAMVVTVLGEMNFTLDHALHAELLKDYNKYARPANATDAVEVRFGIALQHIEELDEKKEILTAFSWLKMGWVDPRLSWEKKSDYAEFSSIRIPPEKLWIPDIMPYNGVGDMSDDLTMTLAIVYKDGTVSWIPPLRTETICQLDLRKFPFDEQACILKFGSWTYDGSKVNITIRYGDVDTSTYSSHISWSLFETSLRRNVLQYDCCEEPYIDVTVKLHLRRHTALMNHVFVGPSVILAFAIPIAFVLPVDSKQKMTVGVGLLVSQVLLLLMLENAIPATHVVPLIGLYYLSNIILISLSLVFGALVINIWNRGTRNRDVPAILRAIFLGLLGRILFVRQEDYAAMDDLESARKSLSGSEMANSDTKQLVTKFTIKGAWSQFAAVVDRLLFVVYVIVLLCVTIIMLS